MFHFLNPLLNRTRWLPVLLVCFTESALAAQPETVQPRSTAADSSEPVCFIQFQGSNAVDLSSLCGQGKKSQTPVVISAPTASTSPPVFNQPGTAAPDGQCYVVDADGRPCAGDRSSQ